MKIEYLLFWIWLDLQISLPAQTGQNVLSSLCMMAMEVISAQISYETIYTNSSYEMRPFLIIQKKQFEMDLHELKRFI